jgi:ketosteroid isomerase-like protein
MREVANIETVRSLYAAFGRGDVAGVLERLDETVVWISPGSEAVPLSGRRRGVEEVRAFFEQLAQNVTFTVFQAREFLAQGNRVIALVHYEGRNRTTGREFTAESAMLWTLGNGRVLRFQEYTDTEALAEAARPGELQAHRAG